MWWRDAGRSHRHALTAAGNGPPGAGHHALAQTCFARPGANLGAKWALQRIGQLREDLPARCRQDLLQGVRHVGECMVATPGGRFRRVKAVAMAS